MEHGLYVGQRQGVHCQAVEHGLYVYSLRVLDKNDKNEQPTNTVNDTTE